MPGRLANGINAWMEDVAAYKGKKKFADIALPYLEAQHKKQLDKGIVVPEREVSSYPF